MRYEDHIRKVCGDNWKSVNNEERQGGYAVAMLISYMRGVKPSLSELSKHLGVNQDELSQPYVRLLKNGAFAKDGWNAKEDPDLLGNTTNEDAYRVWAHVAAVGSGFLGVPS